MTTFGSPLNYFHSSIQSKTKHDKILQEIQRKEHLLAHTIYFPLSQASPFLLRLINKIASARILLLQNRNLKTLKNL